MGMVPKSSREVKGGKSAKGSRFQHVSVHGLLSSSHEVLVISEHTYHHALPYMANYLLVLLKLCSLHPRSTFLF